MDWKTKIWRKQVGRKLGARCKTLYRKNDGFKLLIIPSLTTSFYISSSHQTQHSAGIPLQLNCNGIRHCLLELAMHNPFPTQNIFFKIAYKNSKNTLHRCSHQLLHQLLHSPLRPSWSHEWWRTHHPDSQLNPLHPPSNRLPLSQRHHHRAPLHNSRHQRSLFIYAAPI